MAYIEGEERGQHNLFPTTLDELIPQDHICRMIEAFVGRLDMAKLGFIRSEPAETGRTGYDPRDLLKLYLSMGTCGRSGPRAGWKPSASATWK
jgi:transposase